MKQFLLCFFFFVFSMNSAALDRVHHETLFSHPFVDEEEPKTELPFFLYPNELKAHFLSAELRKKSGILVSVGSFRGLFNATMGNFSHVFLVDNDRAILRFNRANLALLKALSQSNLAITMQRLLYVAIISQRSFTLEAIRELTNMQESSRIVFSRLYRELSPQSVVDSAPQELDEALRYAIEKFYESDSGEHPNRLFEVDDLNGKNISMTYWQSDAAFAKLTNLINEDKISVVAGDITGAKTINSIANFAKRQKELVSVFDVSNAIDSFYKDTYAMSRFLKNVFRLSSEHLTIVSTVKKNQNWYYLLLAPEVIPIWAKYLAQVHRDTTVVFNQEGIIATRLNKYVFDFALRIDPVNNGAVMITSIENHERDLDRRR